MRLVSTLLRFESYDMAPGHYSDTVLRIKIFDRPALHRILEWKENHWLLSSNIFERNKNLSYSYLLLCVLCIISLQRHLLYKSIVEDAGLFICHLLVNTFTLLCLRSIR